MKSIATMALLGAMSQTDVQALQLKEKLEAQTQVKAQFTQSATAGSCNGAYKTLMRESTATITVPSGKKFEDVSFPANKASTGETFERVWKRPSELTKTPILFRNNMPNWADVGQGHLGDCWLIAAISAIGEYAWMPIRNLGTTTYPANGMFKLKVFFLGRRIHLYIDDRLPTHDGKSLQYS